MDKQIRIFSNAELEAGPSTANMLRRQAFAGATFWIGEVRTHPGAVSGWHHHGDYTTYGYIVAGRVRFQFGPNGDQRAEAGPGDFFLVPPHTIHREDNPGSEEQVIVLARVGEGPNVINVDGPDPT